MCLVVVIATWFLTAWCLNPVRWWREWSLWLADKNPDQYKAFIFQPWQIFSASLLALSPQPSYYDLTALKIFGVTKHFIPSLAPGLFHMIVPVSETFLPAPYLPGLLLFSFQVLHGYHFPWKFFPDSQVCVKGPSLTCTSSTAAHKLLHFHRLLTHLHLPLGYGKITCLYYSAFAVDSYCSACPHLLLFWKIFYLIQLVRMGLLSSYWFQPLW